MAVARPIYRRPVRQYDSRAVAGARKLANRLRVVDWMAAALMTVAMTLDLVEALLEIFSVGTVTLIAPLFGNIIFPLWFIILGVSYTKKSKNLYGAIGGGILNFIPILGYIGWTITISRQIGSTQFDDGQSTFFSYIYKKLWKNIGM